MSTPPTAAAPRELFGRIQLWMRWLKIILISIAGIFVCLLAAEVVRIYQTAASVHPALGILWILALMAGAALLAIPVYRFFSVPRAIRPPVIPAAEEMEESHLRAELRFLDRYLGGCARNPEFEDKAAAIQQAREELVALRERLAVTPFRDVDEELKRWTATTMSAILENADARAERIIYQEALAVGLATAASPNGTLDAFVMLWRSLNLASKLAILYYGRPGPMGTLAICRDVSLATISAAYLQNISDSLGGLLTKTVGGVAGVVAGPAVDGITNSLVLIRIGYLTKERCRSFRHWNTSAQRSALTRALAATQKVSFGLTSEILRQVGTGIGAVAGAAASSITQAAEVARQSIVTAAGTAFSTAAGWSQRITHVFTGRKEPRRDPAAPPPPDREDGE